GGYWTRVGLVAGAGLVMALSQLLGGWTKWGWPRISAPVLLFAFVPIAIACLWVVLAGQPTSTWLSHHVQSWSGSIGIGGLVSEPCRARLARLRDEAAVGAPSIPEGRCSAPETPIRPHEEPCCSWSTVPPSTASARPGRVPWRGSSARSETSSRTCSSARSRAITGC